MFTLLFENLFSPLEVSVLSRSCSVTALASFIGVLSWR